MNRRVLLTAERFTIRKRLEKHICAKISGFEIKSKDKSPLMQLLSGFLFFNDRFLTNYTTTFYPKIYVPELPFKPNNHLGAISTLAHEYVHLSDRKKMGLVFNFLYLSPQILAILGVLGFILGPWYFLFLLFILPWPSPGRTWAELRGYRMTLAIRYWLAPYSDIDFLINKCVYQFISSSYYWMMPFKSLVHKALTREFDKIKRNELSTELKEIKLVLGV